MKYTPASVLLLLAAFLCTASAQDPAGPWWQNFWWTGTQTMERGAYRGTGAFLRVAKGSNISVSPGCMVEGLRAVDLGDVKWNARDSIFLDGAMALGLGAKLDAADCLFQNFEISRTSRTENDLWSMSLAYDNCVIAVKFMPKIFSVTSFSVRASHCTFLDISLPGILYKNDPAREAQSEELKFANCRFIRCEVPESFLAATVDCVFEDCTFLEKREDWSKATKPIQVNAAVAGRLPLSYVNWNLKVAFKLTQIPGAGATIKYTYANHRLAYAEARSPGEIHVLGTIKNQPPPAVAAAPTATTEPPSAPAPAAPPQISAEAQEQTAQLVKTHRNNLVFVSGSNGSGSGFLAKFGAGTFLITNAHVAAGVKGAGFKTLQGDAVKAGAAAVAVGHDIFLMQASAAQPLEIMTGVDENTSIGDEIVVLGNAEGAGVINTIVGRIVGVGPNLVEVDAPFKPGNSGSPIIHIKSGKVIGAATYLTIRKFDSATKQPVKEPIVRRFGYRLDSIKSWQPVQWPAFLAQAQEMETIEGLTDDLVKFLTVLGNGKISSSLQTNAAIKSRIDAWQTSRSRGLSLRDRQNVDQNFISYLKVTCQADITAAHPRMTYDYFQRQLTEQESGRKEIADIFDKIIKDIQTGR